MSNYLNFISFPGNQGICPNALKENIFIALTLGRRTPRPMLLKLQCVSSAFPGHLMKMQILNLPGVSGPLRFCICNMLPGDADSAGQGESHSYSRALGQSE